MRHNVSLQKFMDSTMLDLVRSVEKLTEEVKKLNINLELVSRMDSDNAIEPCECEECRGMKH